MQNLLDEKWALVKNDLETAVSTIAFDLWIKNTKPINIEEGQLVLVCANINVKNAIFQRFAKDIVPSVQKHFKLEGIKLILEEEKEDYIERFHLLEKNEENKEELPKAVTNEEEPTNPLNPSYTFDTFVVGSTNKVIYAATRNVAENPGKRFNPLFIYGGVGLGKTHLLHAIGNFIWDTQKGKVKIVYVTSETFVNDFIEVLQKGKDKGTVEFRKKYRKADVLLVDDIQFFGGKTKVQEEFFNTFNDLYSANKQIILAADRPPKEIFGLEERLASRFSSGLVQDIQKPDYETRLLIIRKKIELFEYNFDEKILPRLAEKLENFNIREIEGVLNKLNLLSGLYTKPEVDEEVMNEVFARPKELDESVDRVVTKDKIIDAVCIKFNITRDDLFGKKRTKELVEPRQYCIYLMWKKLAIPLTAISKLFNRDHTTAIHARDKVIELMKTDGAVKKLVEELEDLVVH